MHPARYCTRCNSELPAGAAAGGPCPRCLLLLGLGAENADGEAPDSVTTGGAEGTAAVQPETAWSLVGVRLGCYEVREVLGDGGMGRVYAAEDTRLGRIVALKVLPPEMAADPSRLERFRREARALAALNHPGIVTIHSIEEANGLHFLIMERVAGHTLAELLPEGGMPLDRILGLALPLVEALGAAHEAGVVHRDLKPANVMVGSGGRVKLLDFGLARTAEEPGGGGRVHDPSLTQQGLILGTLPYLSPEQVQGRRADRRSDLFSLGVLLFEMATGQRPFRGETAPELLAAILRDAPPRLRDLRPDLPASLDGAVARCLEKDPERRGSGVAEVVAALGRAADGRAFGDSRRADLPAEPPGVRAGTPPVPEGSDPFLTPSPGEPLSVGRTEELACLHGWLGEALTGSRRTVFVTGDAGLGKTALVEAFVREARRRHRLWLAHGQCLERQGPGEAYMPVLEALGRMGRGEDGRTLVSLLARLAPSWLVQMPSLVADAELATLEHRSLGATQERMLREMVETVDALCRDRPVLLVLEDLHWSDYSTVDLVAALARRPDPARLLLVCTFRPGETGAVDGVCQELATRAGRQCFELPLGLLDLEAVATYLERRFPGAALPDRLPERVHGHTDGNPLFLESVTASWIERGLAVRCEDGRWRFDRDADAFCNEVPPTLRKMIERQLDGLSPDSCELLDAASVAGCRFSAAAVGAALDLPDEESESRCDRLARESRFLRARGSEEWPDGTLSTRFAFAHDLYQRVLYERLPAARRARLHREVGGRLETAYRSAPRERAAELAVHFVNGRDAPRAVEYLRLAAEHALRRSAYREAVDHLVRALELLPRLPEGDERLRAELELQSRLAPARIAVEGWSSPGVEQAYLRALELAERCGDRASLSPVLYGLATMCELRGRYQDSEALLEERLGLTAPGPGRGPDLPAATELLESRELLACSAFHQGHFAEALEHARKGIDLFVPESHRWLSAQENLGVSCHDWAALSLWFLGFPERAVEEALRAIDLAEELDHPYTQAHAEAQAATVFQCRREVSRARKHAEAALDLSVEHGFPFRISTGEILLGWCLAVAGAPEEGLPRIEKGLAIYRRMGAEMDRPYYLALLAEAQWEAGRATEALATLEEAVASAPARRGFFYAPEFHRLRGEILRRWRPTDGAPEAEASFRQALAMARDQGARSLELRAAVDLAYLLAGRDDGAEGRRLVAEVYRRFEEGFDTLDLRRARELAAPDEVRGESAV